MKSLAIIPCLLLTGVLSSHFRGSMVTWRVVNTTTTPLVVELLQRHAWNWLSYPCNDTRIAAGNYMIGSGSLVCATTCPTNISTLASVAVPCTAYNMAENFTSGEGRVQVRIPTNSRFTAIFEGSAWFTLLLGGGNWSVSVLINTYKRSNGQYNQAPIVTMLPVIRLRRNHTYNIRINVADNDFDPYICRWSNTSSECSGVCMKTPTSTVLNPSTCMLTFTGPTVGFYAIALTIIDYESLTNTTELSRVPMEFIFHIWDSNDSCSLPPLYLGEAPADQCIYVEPGQVLIMRVVIRVQCPNATLDSIFGVFPVGFTRSVTTVDPIDSTVYLFMVTYTATVQQIGQNLFCFAGVDSIGNQADTTCLRFTVQQGSSSMNTLYLTNATRYPAGNVSKYQSTWTLIYPNGSTYSRPSASADIRFKLTSSQADFLTIDVSTDSNVAYQSDRLVITTSITFTPGQSFFISFDPGVFLAASTCLRDSMGITDSSFWTFSVPSDPSTTPSTTPTTTTAATTTLRIRTVPSIRTVSTTVVSSTTVAVTTSTLPNILMTGLTSTDWVPSAKKDFPVSGIVGILLGVLVVIPIIIKLLQLLPKMKIISKTTPQTARHSIVEMIQQYRVTTRMNRRRSTKYAIMTESLTDGSKEQIGTSNNSDMVTSRHLVEIHC